MKKIKNKIENLGLNYKKEMIMFFIGFSLIVLLALVSLIFLKNALSSLLAFLLLIIFTFYYFYRYMAMEDSKKAKNIDNFIEYFSYFRIYIFNGESVYSALEKTLEFSDYQIKAYAEGLITGINDVKTITPFMRFSNFFNNKLIEEIMISIYEMIENGNDSNYINQFTTLFEDFKLRTNKENEAKRLGKFDKYTMSSLVGSGIIMIILVYGIINLIGTML